MPESTESLHSIRKSSACDECKRRKIRCSGGAQCTSCAKDSRTCQYSSAWQKFSSLQRRLRESESARREIEKLWALYHPDIDLNQALERARSSATCIDTPATDPKLDISATISDHESARSEKLSLALTEDSNAEDYEFDESKDLESAIDGMVSLTSDPHKAGYTGSPSGIAALKFLQSLPPYLPITYASPLAALQSQDSITSPMQSQATVETYINAYFAWYHPAYPILHEGTFRARLSGALAKPRDGSWPLLYNAVLAIGAFVSDTQSTNSDIPFLTEARRHLSMEVLEKGSLSYVQALVLLANYLQKRNKPNAGFMLIGLAYNMALAIGLHREFSSSCTSTFTMEIRRRVWWTLFAFVSGSQLALGRPSASLVGVNVRLPTNLDDSDLAVDLDKLPEAKTYPTVSSCLIEQVRLTKIANAIHGELLTHHRPSYAKVISMEDSIQSWSRSLPQFFDRDTMLDLKLEFPKRVLLWRSSNLRIVLNRPFLFETIIANGPLNVSTGPTSSCLMAADDCIASISDFLSSAENIKRGFAWYATTWLITASFVQATCLVYDAKHAAAGQWQASLCNAVRCLQLLGSFNTIAVRACDILKNVLGQRDYPQHPLVSLPFTNQFSSLSQPEGTEDGVASNDIPQSVYATDLQPELFPWMLHSGSDSEEFNQQRHDLRFDFGEYF